MGVRVGFKPGAWVGVFCWELKRTGSSAGKTFTTSLRKAYTPPTNKRHKHRQMPEIAKRIRMTLRLVELVDMDDLSINLWIK
jgi:hypothetical protein